MNSRIVIGSLFSLFILLIMPSIPAIEFNTIIDENEQQLTEKIQNIAEELNLKTKDISIKEIRQNIATLKQQLSEHYVDIELILIVILGVLLMALTGGYNLPLMVGTVVLAIVALYEFVSGVEIVKCSKIHTTLVLALTTFLVVLEGTLMSNKVLSKIICTITLIIGYTLALLLMFNAQA